MDMYNYYHSTLFLLRGCHDILIEIEVVNILPPRHEMGLVILIGRLDNLYLST